MERKYEWLLCDGGNVVSIFGWKTGMARRFCCFMNHFLSLNRAVIRGKVRRRKFDFSFENGGL